MFGSPNLATLSSADELSDRKKKVYIPVLAPVDDFGIVLCNTSLLGFLFELKELKVRDQNILNGMGESVVRVMFNLF